VKKRKDERKEEKREENRKEIKVDEGRSNCKGRHLGKKYI
jgi:hypothetical protein